MTVTKFRHPEQIKLAHKSAVETALPAHLMILAHESAQEKGFQFRPDILERLNNAAQAALTVLPDLEPVAAARRTDDVAVSLLRDLQVDHPVEAFMAAAHFCLKLVDEGFLADKTNMAVLVAMLVTDEINTHEAQQEQKFNVAAVQLAAHRMLTRAQFQGLYDLRPDQLPKELTVLHQGERRPAHFQKAT